MVELAEIFRLHGPAYREQFGARMLPSHRRAMQDIELSGFPCLTSARGRRRYDSSTRPKPKRARHPIRFTTQLNHHASLLRNSFKAKRDNARFEPRAMAT